MVSWKEGCKPKNIGGLGIRNLLFWNQCAVGKIAWHIYTMKESLWVRWVHGVYTKGGQRELFNAPPTASWVMRKLCLIKDTLQCWIVKDTYSIKSVYLESFQSYPKVRWRFVVWNKMFIPRHRFCVWLMALGKLKTKDKLFSIGVTADDVCPLCATSKETVRHLFFDCPFSRKCLASLESWVGVRFKYIEHMDFRKLKLRKPQQHILCTIYACTIYYIWRSRNTACWDHLVPLLNLIVLQIKAQTDLRLRSVGIFDAVDAV